MIHLKCKQLILKQQSLSWLLYSEKKLREWENVENFMMIAFSENKTKLWLLKV